ncbi:MAG: PEGA domain-containing protein [Leptospiraceae bacterium]|nr:PEGA domain-containing protein [Leptospiraceae bacterium]MCK6380973.1 PEGA domain-containing protein [Leptospiraceae bacterium]NUM41004.1 PEGA domain-containing protein [Leptospiraceae bacterium]
MKTITASILLFCFITNATSLFSIDEYFDFKNQYLPEKIEFEKKRKLCLFPFRKPENQKKLDYLSKGIPSILFTGLNSMKFIYDEDVLPIVINHPYGKKKETENEKLLINKFTPDSINLKMLNEGKLKLLPSKDPRYIDFSPEIIAEKETAFLENAIYLGRKNQCYYVITGEYNVKSEDSLFVKIELTNLRDGKVNSFSESTSIKRAFQELEKTIIVLKRSLNKKEMASIEVSTGDEKNTLIFLDGAYLGKTPIDKKEVVSGKHELFLFKDGFLPQTKEIQISTNSQNTFRFELKKIEAKGKISVVSDPPGADVYLGMTLLGQTPLKNISVPVGSNQVRVSKETYIDFFKGVDIVDSKEFKLDVKLKTGDSEIYYKNRANVFLDYTYYDFSIFSLFSTLFFYAGFIYADLRSSQLTDELRSQYAFANITSILRLQGTLTQNEFLATYTYQEIQIQKIRSEIKNWDQIGSNRKGHRLKGIAPAGVGIMLVLSVVFYALGIDEETIEFGMKPIFMQNQESTESYIRIKKSF